MKTNFLKVFGISTVALLGMTACSTVIANPTDYSDSLITAEGYDKQLYNNVASVVYDAIHDNGIGSKVLDQTLYLYAVKEFGAFDGTVVAGGVPVGLGEVTLSTALESTDNLNNFVSAHKVYWDSSRTDANAPASATERTRVKAKLDTINDRIAVKMYNKISGGSYSDRHIFYEERFLNSLRTSLQSVQDPATAPTGTLTVSQILPEVEPEKVFEKELLHREHYQSEANTYIVDEIVPTIYRELLNELYVNEETYSTLGRSYARKVNIIEFKNNSEYPSAAYYLAKSLASEINKPADSYTINDIQETFKLYSKAAVGVVTAGTAAADLLELSGGFEHKSDARDGVGDYYLGTEYGDLAKKYVDMLNAKTVDSSAESSFSNSNAYPTYIGLGQQKMALEEKDYVTSGWYIKNGGLTSLPESIRSRLFNISVANGVKEKASERADYERTYSDGEWHEGENENAYVCRINGHNYLKKESRVKGEGIENDILHYDASSKSYFIVEIEEAVSVSKLSKDSSNNYAATRENGAQEMEDIINEVGKIVAEGESYPTLAAKKYLKAMGISYHDDSVYEYFKSNYPELFE